MTPSLQDIAERFVLSTQSANLSSQAIHINRGSGVSTTFPSGAINSVIAAGWARRLGSSLFRLKYGLDTSVYRSVLTEFRLIAIEAAHLLEWPDNELTEFAAEFALLAWLTDRPLRGELAERIGTLKRMLTEEESQTALFMAKALC